MRESFVISILRRRRVLLMLGAILCLADLRSEAAAPKFPRPRSRRPAILRVAVPPGTGGPVVDPARAQTPADLDLARNLYGRLLEYDQDGELVPGLVSSFEWRGQSLVLTFGDRARTARGRRLTADDAARSLRRAMSVRAATDAALIHALCGGTPASSAEAPCAGITVTGDELRLDSVDADFDLARALAQTAYGIVPAAASSRAVDFDPRESTGPYVLVSSEPTIQLRADPEHYAYDAAMPQLVEFIVVPVADVGRALEAGAVDLISLTLSGSTPLPARVRAVATPFGRASHAFALDRRWSYAPTAEAVHLEIWKMRSTP